MKTILKTIDWVSIWTGKFSSYLTLIAALVVVYEVLMRHFLHLPTLWAAEFTSMACSALYLLGGAWVFYQNKHVNIEMLYEKFSAKSRALADAIGYGFFAVYTGMMTWFSAKFALESIQLHETTSSAWDPIIYPSKSILALGFFILLLQGTAKFVRDVFYLIKGERL